MGNEQVNKVAIVTGATGGIGFEVAKRLGQDGYTVALNGIEDDKGAERVAELTNEGINAEYYGFDVTDEEQVNSNINAIGQKYGKIDVLVNNAGGLGGRSRFEEMTTEFYRNKQVPSLKRVEQGFVGSSITDGRRLRGCSKHHIMGVIDLLSRMARLLFPTTPN